MILNLVQMPDTLKGPDNDSYRGQVPRRMRYLAPQAATSLLTLEKEQGKLRYSDMWRSASSSLLAHRTKRGTQAPGFSAHNYGLAVDLDLGGVIQDRKCSYQDILELMQKYGWYCHRRDEDGPNQMEAWHFNYLGSEADRVLLYSNVNKPGTWSIPVDMLIRERYGQELSLSPVQTIGYLKKLGFFHGEEGEPPDSLYMRECVIAFQRAWDLEQDGVPGPRTQRTLAFVSADIHIHPTPNV